MTKLFLFLILSFFSTQSFAGSCPDGSEPVKSISSDGYYYVYNCGNTDSNNTKEPKASINGRWKGIVNCKWDGNYSLNNGALGGMFDFTIRDGWDNPDEKILKTKSFLSYQKSQYEIKSYHIDRHSFSAVVKYDWGEESQWSGVVNNNIMTLRYPNNGCIGRLSKVEEISFESYSPKMPIDFIDGVKDDPRFTITGLLILPEQKKDKYPVMVMVMHSGCSFGARDFTYGHDIRKLGVATLELDLCEPRGLSENFPILQGNFYKLTPWMGAADALYALKFLQGHPKIDSNKIGIVGWSWGGNVALYTNLDIIRKPILPESDYSLSVAYYPLCRYLEKQQVSNTKLHIFIGDKDEATRASFCKDMVKSINDFGGNASLDVYPDSYHSFDDIWRDSKPKYTSRMFNVTEDCKYWVDSDGRRSWRLNDMQIDLDDYDSWDLSADVYGKEYSAECDHWGLVQGRTDSTAQQSAVKLMQLIRKFLL